jgi:hypothetical protein
MHRPPLRPRRYSWYSCLLKVRSTPRPILQSEGLSLWNIPITPSGIETVTSDNSITACPAVHRIVKHYRESSAMNFWLRWQGVHWQFRGSDSGTAHCSGCSLTFWLYCSLALLASVTGGSWPCVKSLNTRRNSRNFGEVGLNTETFKWENG